MCGILASQRELWRPLTGAGEALEALARGASHSTRTVYRDACMCIYIYMHTYLFKYIHMHVYAFYRVYLYIPKFVSRSISNSISIPTCLSIPIHDICACIHTQIDIYIYAGIYPFQDWCGSHANGRQPQGQGGACPSRAELAPKGCCNCNFRAPLFWGPYLGYKLLGLLFWSILGL